MAWPRSCASNSSAKVESPRMLIRSIGSICTATFNVIAAPKLFFANASYHPIASAAGVESREDMARNTPRRHQHRIETDIADTRVGESRQPSLSGCDDAQALAISDRPSGVVQLFACLDLDEQQQASAARDNVDFADRALPPPRQDAEAFGDEERRRPAFGRNTGAKCDLTLGAGSLDRTCARPLIDHGRAPS